MRDLDVATTSGYRSFLERHPEEWEILDALCRVTVSRFYRDKEVFALLERAVLPELAAGARAQGFQRIVVWSAGCASGEEPYTLALLWRLRLAVHFPDLDVRILATDADPAMIDRARRARYRASSLRDLPEAWRAEAFERSADGYVLRAGLAEGVSFLCHDVRTEPPDGPFQLVLCRNAAFTYFASALQREVAERLKNALCSGGVLAIGSCETLPPGARGFEPWSGGRGVYRRC